MRVLSFADTRFPIERANGVQTMATCHALALRGHEVTLVVREDTAVPPRDPFAFYGVPPTPALTINAVKTVSGGTAQRVHFLSAVLRRARTAQADVVFTRDLGIAELLLRVPGRPPVVYESHGISWIVAEERPALLGSKEPPPSPRKLRRLRNREAFVWRRANGYVTITEALADDLALKLGRRERVHIVPDGAHPHESPSPPAGPPVAGYAGHLYPWKGIDVFVRALALTPGIGGIIVGGHPGEADLARVERLVTELGMGDRVTITGLVPPADVTAGLAAATMLVLPNPPSVISERYTSPLKLFEYLWLRRPIIASDLPAFREVLEDGQSARLFEPGDHTALAEALMEVASNPDLADRLVEGAAARAPEFTWEKRALRLEQALIEAVRP
jgi:glycosyltransferase involved in cell wall biosynthesis